VRPPFFFISKHIPQQLPYFFHIAQKCSYVLLKTLNIRVILTDMMTNKGISIFATVLIIALVAVAGIALVQVSKNATVDVDMDEMHSHEEQEAAKKLAQNTLLQLKSAVNLEVDEDISMAVQAIENIKLDLVTAYRDAHEAEQVELLEIMARLDQISMALQARSAAVFEEIDNALRAIDAYLPAEMQLGDSIIETTTEIEVDGEEDEDTDEEAGTMVDVEVDVEATTEAELE